MTTIVENNPNKESFSISQFFCNAARETGRFLYETPAEILAYSVAGIALHVFRPEMSSPFIATAAASLATRLGVKVIDKVKPDLLYSLKQETYRLDSKYPHIKTIALVAAIVACLFSPIAGAFIGAALGIYSGLTTSIRTRVDVMELHQLGAGKPRGPAVHL